VFAWAGGGPAKVDHIAYTVTNWDAEKDGLEEELKRRGLQYRGAPRRASTSRTRRGWEYSSADCINDDRAEMRYVFCRKHGAIGQ
jgi:hypothetical protein